MMQAWFFSAIAASSNKSIEDFEQDDFELIENQDPPREGKIYAIAGTVTIKRKSNGTGKLYRAGHETAWTTEFSDDLNNGVFG